ncbi:transposase [Escherichia coli]|uniref:transposase n=1 Tax=Escherichia coli TaxID=562 RepID=UPI0010CC8862|nr:transposase [Escherichia coli]GCY10659.1 ISEcp1 transposase [Escherichia coli]
MIMVGSVLQGEGFSVSFNNREVTAWGGLALLKQMLDSMGFRQASAGWGLPEPRSNRGYAPLQLIEQFIVSIWCGACRFAHAETVRMDSTLVRLFGWTKAAGHKAIMRLFARFDMLTNERVQAEAYRWFFGKISALKRVTLDVDSTVITRNGNQEGAARGYNPNRQGRASHHPLLAFVAESRMVANFWLRPGTAHSANNILQFLESTLHHLGDKTVGLLRADSGFFDESGWHKSVRITNGEAYARREDRRRRGGLIVRCPKSLRTTNGVASARREDRRRRGGLIVRCPKSLRTTNGVASARRRAPGGGGEMRVGTSPSVLLMAKPTPGAKRLFLSSPVLFIKRVARQGRWVTACSYPRAAQRRNGAESRPQGGPLVQFAGWLS